jgi:uncharacterized damage-inducible protein DinB
MTIPHFLDQLNYTLWANKRSLASIEALAEKGIEPPERAVNIMAHVVAAQYIWLARVVSKPEIALPVWGNLTITEMRERIPAVHEQWKEFLAGKTDNDIPTTLYHYKNSLGQEYTNTLLEILTHFPIHAEHHRGQIAILVRDAGGTPLLTDYIQFAREEHTR